MAHPSGERLLVLHALRLKGLAAPDVVAGWAGLPERKVAAVLDGLVAEGLVSRREGRLAGWALTPAGRQASARLLRAELAEAGCEADVAAAYDRFLALNTTFLTVATAWQVRDDGPVPRANDHGDPDYDAAVVARLAAVHDEIVPVARDLAGCLDRFSPYAGRFADALERVQAGAAEWFTRPLIDSYHTVWFELHEDLLATLGRERAAEGAEVQTG